MRRALASLLVGAFLAGLCGGCRFCNWLTGDYGSAPATCTSCDSGACTVEGVGCETCGGEGCPDCIIGPAGEGYVPGGEEAFAPGPRSGTVTYPYYTNRGPRDFLTRNPRNIGP